MKRLLGLMAMVCLMSNAFGQHTIKPFYIGDRVPDLPLYHIINYKDSVAPLSSFGNKLVILDFWGVHCSTCIHMFPLEDSLQHIFKNAVQFVLVTMDSTQKVKKFLNRWDSNHNKALCLPVETSDVFFYKLFRLKYIPHYIWLMPNGTLLAQTSEDFINEKTIRETLKAIAAKERELKEDGFADDMFHFPPLTDRQKLQFSPFLKSNTLP